MYMRYKCTRRKFQCFDLSHHKYHAYSFHFMSLHVFAGFGWQPIHNLGWKPIYNFMASAAGWKPIYNFGLATLGAGGRRRSL